MRRALLVLGFLAGGFLLWLLAVWPPPLWYRTHWPRETAFMAMRDAARRNKPDARPVRYRPVPLDSIAPSLVEAVIIGEDGNFYQHGGIDYLSLAHALGYRRQTLNLGDPRDRAAFLAVLPRAWGQRDKLRGASTVTQQLAKNLYLSPSRNPLRKVKEAVIAWRLEWALDKRRIMELYLNIVELGDGIWGVEAASQAYFNRSARRLSTEQAAALAGTLPFPLSSNPGHRPGRMRWRQNLILRRMRGEAVEVPKVETESEAEPPASTADSTAAPADSLPAGMDSFESLPDSGGPPGSPPPAPGDSALVSPDVGSPGPGR
jgi:monofunctional biosynthetic peptidoglycan transglycosylase